MGVISNEDQPQVDNSAATAGPGSTTGQSFAGATVAGAPTGGTDFLGLRRLVGLNRTDGTVEPYLQAVLEYVRKALPDVTYIRLNRMSNTYAFQHDGPDGAKHFFGILFAASSDPTPQNYTPISMRMGPMLDELREENANIPVRLADARVILSNYAADMDRTFEMADLIVRTFNVTAKPEVKNATIDSLIGTEFVADWSLSEARKIERQLSPHGVAPRMDIALTLKAKIQRNLGRELKEYEVDYQPLGVIGGYVEVRPPEMVVVNGMTKPQYRPVFNITVLNSVIPLEGIAAILMAAFAPSIYTTKFWANQWQSLSENDPNPGLLEEDQNNRGRPYVLKNREELAQFLNEFFTTAHVAFQFQDGKDSIPGMWRMATSASDQKKLFGDRLSNFFGSANIAFSNLEIARTLETRYDGVYGEPNGTLEDSRKIDVLYVAARNGFASMDAMTKQVLMAGSDNPADRAGIVANVTGSFTPVSLDSIAVINPDFIKHVIGLTDGRRLTIVDPNSHNEVRPFSSFTAGFGTIDGMGSLISNGAGRRSFGLNSVWN